MEILLDYHLVFIVIAFAMLILTILLVSINPTKEQTFASMIFAGINYLICMFNSFALFAIGIIGYKPDGSIEITAYSGMYSVYVIFMLLLFINVALLFYCYWLWVRKPWDLDTTDSITTQTYP